MARLRLPPMPARPLQHGFSLRVNDQGSLHFQLARDDANSLNFELELLEGESGSVLSFRSSCCETPIYTRSMQGPYLCRNCNDEVPEVTGPDTAAGVYLYDDDFDSEACVQGWLVNGELDPLQAIILGSYLWESVLALDTDMKVLLMELKKSGRVSEVAVEGPRDRQANRMAKVFGELDEPLSYRLEWSHDLKLP